MPNAACMSSDPNTYMTDSDSLGAQQVHKCPGSSIALQSDMQNPQDLRQALLAGEGRTSEMGPLRPLSSITIGTIGHVAHGKSTLVKAITGTKTLNHKSEHELNMTIKLGYASGHDVLMRTMLAGTLTMDAALLVISANEPCPQPQTIEHLATIEALGLTNIIIVQNRINLVDGEQAIQHTRQVRDFLKGTTAEGAPVIPISAHYQINIDTVLDILFNSKPPIRDFTSPPRLTIVRSFDINRPGSSIHDLRGGVAGGTVTRGVLRIHDEIELRPGLIIRNVATGMLT